MARILGLDLGASSVKALLLEGSRTSARPTFFEVPRGEGEPAQTLRAALDQLAREVGPPPDQVVVALPGPGLATHPVTLPFTDPKRIEATLPFEVESQLPFDLSEASFDYQVAGPRDPGSTKAELLVGVARKDELRGLIATLSEHGLDPKVVTHPAMAYQNLLRALPIGGGGPVAILDFGHERTCVAVGQPGGELFSARAFAVGGTHLTRALAAELRVDAAQARQWKEAHASLGPSGDPDGERIAAALVKGLQPLLRELRPTLKASSARSRQQLSRLLLCGGSAALPGLASQLSRDLGVPVEPLELPEEVARALPEGLVPHAALACALALRGQTPAGPRAPRFNLRRGELAFRGHYDYVREKVGLLAAFAATLILLFIGYGVAQNTLLAGREKQVDQELCRITQRVLGACEMNYDRALNMLSGQKSPAAAIPQLSAVQLLSELTQRIPAEAHVTLDQIVIDLDRVSVKGQTDSSSQIDKIAASLRKYECFKEVQEGKIERSRDGKHVSFRFQIQVACPAQAARAG